MRSTWTNVIRRQPGLGSPREGQTLELQPPIVTNGHPELGKSYISGSPDEQVGRLAISVAGVAQLVITAEDIA